ncbi:MAG: D-tyrosyl-tRNA(Tyr) deacylase [Saprospiraceae bacterium]|nr:D-tyrosyl-tRNA(Tyr) deacylase [Saprospiraceae bacterium]
MRVVLQRVKGANLEIDKKVFAQIQQGLVVLLAIESSDESSDAEWLINKIINLRIFSDQDGQMNLSVEDIKGQILLVSQFTLFASTKKGNRPGFTRAASPKEAKEMYLKFVSLFKQKYKYEVQEGVFGADMQIHLINDGPVTIIIDTKNKE